MMSVNQMAIYHTLLEAFNVLRNSSSEEIKTKWTEKQANNYSFRSTTGCNIKVPTKPSKNSINFTYTGAKLFNMLPRVLKETENKNVFKAMIKDWIWQNIPSY